MPSFDAVEQQYDAFPYPQPSVVARQLPAEFLRGSLSFLTRRRAADWFSNTMRIWIAGCGTQQAAMWALCHPRAEIVATDLSQTALDIARSLLTLALQSRQGHKRRQHPAAHPRRALWRPQR